MAAAPTQPDFGQTLTKGVKYLKINKIDKDGEDFGSQLNAADNLVLNYPDIGSIQYNILTTQEQDGCYLMGVIPVENTSSLNNIKNLDLNIFKASISKTLIPQGVAVWNPDNDGGVDITTPNEYFNETTDLLDFNLANTPTSITSSVSVTNVNGVFLSAQFQYISVAIPPSSISDWVAGNIPFNSWNDFGIQTLNIINITGDGTFSAQSSLNDNYGGDYYFGGYANVGLGGFTITNITEEINQSTIQPPQTSNPILININPEVEEFDWSDYNAVFGNIDIPQYSQTFMQIDYNTGGTIPTNFELLRKGSAPKASIQDSNYTQRGWSNGRYDGSQNSSTDFNTYNK